MNQSLKKNYQAQILEILVDNLIHLFFMMVLIAKFLMGDSGILFKELTHYFLILQAEVSHK